MLANIAFKTATILTYTFATGFVSIMGYVFYQNYNGKTIRITVFEPNNQPSLVLQFPPGLLTSMEYSTHI